MRQVWDKILLIPIIGKIIRLIFKLIRLIFNFRAFRLAFGVILFCFNALFFSALIYGIDKKMFATKFILVFGILMFLSAILLAISIIIIIVDISAENSITKLTNMYSGLFKWVSNNDVGSATLVVKSLSQNEKVKEYFKETGGIIIEESRSDSKKFKVPSVEKYFLGSVIEIVDLLDEATKEYLVSIDRFIKFENSSKIYKEKIIESILSVTFIASILAALKNGIDYYVNEETKNVGIIIIIFVLSTAVIVGLIVLNMYLKQKTENNAKNFLRFIIKEIKSKNEQEN
ncbi:hypothetical protein LI951_07515 [Enterococcus sp. BWT-B8]|uniref:hypothetical protein n=1 Tax=Enterococcus sp. BWT-B8 TaxID=2885157 RepID=UPI001E3A82E9|nr:hypothetical protein [Enterococcus sp. BWT-B8]MCB5951910.1 hypothetical protein [Enterococcus sp. BWT-B8]